MLKKKSGPGRKPGRKYTQRIPVMLTQETYDLILEISKLQSSTLVQAARTILENEAPKYQRLLDFNKSNLKNSH